MLIPKGVFHVSRCAAKESTRYAINGVNVEREADGKCRATTCDGRRLLTVTWDDEYQRKEFPPIDGINTDPVNEFSRIVPTKQWNEAAKLIPKSYKPVLKHCVLDESTEKEKVRLATTDMTDTRSITLASVEEIFPDRERVMPKYQIGVTHVEIGINPRLLAELLRAVEDIATDDNKPCVRLVVPITPKRPMLVDSQYEGVEATGIIMAHNLNLDDGINTPIGQAKNMAEIIRRLDVDKLDDVLKESVLDVRKAINGEEPNAQS